MAYIGYNPSQLAIAPFATKYFTGDGVTTTFTLDQSVPGANESSVEVFVENVQQNPVDAYTIGGALNNQLIFSEAPVVGGAIYVVHKGEATYNLQPATGSVTANTLDPVLRNFTVDKFTGTGAQTAFTLSDTPYSPNSILVSIDGIVQQAGTNYTLAGTTLTFAAEAPDLGSDITVVHLGFSSGNKAVMDASITPVKLSTGGPSWDTTGNFRVPLGGVITAGDVSSTLGSTVIQGFYSSGGALSVIGTERSSGGLFLGYGVKPSTTQGTPNSSTGVAISRSSIVMNSNVITFNRASSQTVAIGSPVTMTESLRIDTSGNIGIGAGTNTAYPLHIRREDYNQITLIRDLDFNSVGAMGVNILFGGRVGSTETLGASISGVLNSATDGWFDINTRSGSTLNNVARFTGSGVMTLPYGQIKFPAVQNASSDPNTLDDYEEGSFTPTLMTSSVSPVGTYFAATGNCFYVKIASLVNVYGYVNITNTIATGNQWLVITGLPFNMNLSSDAGISGTTNNYPRGSGFYSGIVIDNTSANATEIWLGWNNGTTQVNGDKVYFNLTYRTTT